MFCSTDTDEHATTGVRIYMVRSDGNIGTDEAQILSVIAVGDN